MGCCFEVESEERHYLINGSDDFGTLVSNKPILKVHRESVASEINHKQPAKPSTRRETLGVTESPSQKISDRNSLASLLSKPSSGAIQTEWRHSFEPVINSPNLSSSYSNGNLITIPEQKRLDFIVWRAQKEFVLLETQPESQSYDALHDRLTYYQNDSYSKDTSWIIRILDDNNAHSSQYIFNSALKKI